MTTTATDARSLRIIAAYDQARDTLADLDEGRAYEALDHAPAPFERYAYPWPDETITLGRENGTWGVRVEIADPDTGHLDGWLFAVRGETRPRVIAADDIRARTDVRLGYVEVARRLARSESFRGLPWWAVVDMVRTITEW